MPGSCAGWSGSSSSRRHPGGRAASPACVHGGHPQGFLPEEDQGAIFAILQLPEGASQNSTSEATAAEMDEIIRREPAHGGGHRPRFHHQHRLLEQGLFIVRLKPFEEREDPSLSAPALILKLRPCSPPSAPGSRVL